MSSFEGVFEREGSIGREGSSTGPLSLCYHLTDLASNHAGFSPIAQASEDYDDNLNYLDFSGDTKLAELALVTDEAVVDRVVEFLLNDGSISRRPRSEGRAAIHYLLANLLHYGEIYLPVGKDYYVDAPINPAGVRGKSVAIYRDAMIRSGMMLKTGNHSKSATFGRAAQYKHTSAFRYAIYRHPDDPLILFSNWTGIGDDRTRLISAPDVVGEIKEMHDWVNTYRKKILSHEIRIPHMGRMVRLTQAARVVRIFNRNSTEYGGRLYGPWQTMKKEMRQDITIDGRRIVEVDVKAMHPQMLLAEEGLPGQWDVYQTPAGFKRDLVKSMVLIALNAPSREAAICAWSKKNKRKGAADYYDMAFETMPDVAKHFGKDLGVRLMRKESDYVQIVLDFCAEADVPALPVFDSIMAPENSVEFLYAAMQDAAEELGITNIPLEIQ